MANSTFSMESFLGQIQKATHSAKNSAISADLKSMTSRVSNAVENFIAKYQVASAAGSKGEFSRANVNLSFESLANQIGATGLEGLMAECGVPAQYREACMESVAIAMNRAMMGKDGWDAQNKTMDRSALNAQATPLTSIYPEDVVNSFAEAVPSQEAFGANIDMVVPDMKITMTTAIMNFFARIMPRFMHTRTVDQPSASFTKEYLEIYDLSVQDGKAMRLIDLYANPKFARNELQKIVPLKANDVPGTYVLKDGILLFGPQSNILKLSLRSDLPGYDKMNRTDLIAENVKLEYVYISLTSGSTTEVFQIPAPESFNRLSRATNAHDSADRIGDFKFRFKLYNNSKRASNTISGTWVAADTELLANLTDEEFIAIDVNVKPSVNLKRGFCDCQGSFTVKAGHVVDNAQISQSTKTLAETLAAAAGHGLVGYSLDARFDETNLRKTNISMMTHRVPFVYDIPMGRNYTFDYAIGQVDAEENAANLMKVIGIGQDDVQITGIIKLLENVYDRINSYTVNEENPMDYIGADFVAGDKVRPTVFLGNLDFTKLNIIRDADRTGDVKQRALSYLNGVAARIMQLSFMQQQLGASTTATFRCITSQEVLANVFAPEHIHNHMCKADQRDLGDGVEYVLVLPCGIRLEIITCTFDYMRDKMIIAPVIPGNGESELNLGALYNNGSMVAHYTISGAQVNHRLFANIREIFVPTNPVGAIISISGLDMVSGINEAAVLRPTINTIEVSPYNG